ncbi:isochorismatase family protein [Chitinivorax sp. B]|uniref:isochorismatase family protein n=1 Tax=Chitinivorax sp. B TaxID=2502235 RepID=UPI0010F8A62A|nr:isochorismatase family protein [Chitinivorax sp. B]
MHDAALIVIDMQQGAFDGELIEPIHQADQLINHTVALIEAARAAARPVIFVQHCEGPGELFSEGVPQWRLHPALQRSSQDQVIKKQASSAFENTNLSAVLTDLSVRTVILCGLQSDFCVSNTANAALAGGFDVHVAQDAHSTWPNENRPAAELIDVTNRRLVEAGCKLASTKALSAHLTEAKE